MGKTVLFKYKIWSHDWDLNPGPHPYHGCALPTELSRHTLSFSTRMRSTNDLRFTQELSRRTLSFSTRMRSTNDLRFTQELSRRTLSFSTCMRSTNDLRFTQELSRRTSDNCSK